MSAVVSLLGWEGWCAECECGSGVTTKAEATEWKQHHNEHFHGRNKL